MQIYSSYGSKEREPWGEKQRENEGGKDEKEGAGHQTTMNEKEKYRIKKTTTQGPKKVRLLYRTFGL